MEIVSEDGVAGFPVGVPCLCAGPLALEGQVMLAVAWAPDEYGNALGYRGILAAEVRLGLGGPI